MITKTLLVPDHYVDKKPKAPPKEKKKVNDMLFDKKGNLHREKGL